MLFKHIKILFILILFQIAFSQPMHEPWHACNPDFDPARMEQMKQLRKWRLLEELDLSAEQSDEFLPILRRYEKESEKFDHQRDSTSREIAKLDFSLSNKHGFDIDQAQELIDIVERLQEQKQLLDEEYYQKCREILNPRQHLLLITFDHRFRCEVRHMLKEYMKENNPKPKGNKN